MKKIFLVLFAMIFAGNFFISTAQAEIKTFEGTGAYPLSDEKTHGEVKELAKKEAVRDALEKAGVAVYSETQVKNHTVTKDIIKITVGSILKILSDKYNLIELDENYGIGIYKATVKISIDTDELNLSLKNFLNIDNHEIKHYEELQKLNDANTKRIAELEKQLSEKNSSQNIQQIKDKIATIDKNTLSNQKFDEGFKLCKNDRKFNEAIPIFNEALKLNPNNGDAYRELGWAYTELKDYNKALLYRKKAIELNPNDLYSYHGIAWIYNCIGEYEKAISVANQGIKIDPEFKSFYHARGESYRLLKNYKQAIFDYSKAIQLGHNKGWVYNNRGLCYKALGENKKAEADFAKARQLGWKG